MQRLLTTNLCAVRSVRLIVLIVAAGLSVNIHAQTAPLWGNLDRGPFNVGFKVIYELDHSRSWRSKYDVHGQPQSGTRVRPIRIDVWYPAKDQAHQLRMPYKDYVYYNTPPGDRVFAEANEMLERRAVSSFHSFLKGDDAFNALMSTPTAVIRNARPINRKFPLIIYSGGLNDSLQASNAVLFEYLASHGYVIATVPQLGTSSLSLQLGINPVDLETQVRDLEYAMGVMHDLPDVHADRLSVMGHSMGGVAALILQMRNTEVDAVVGLDATYAAPRLVETFTKSLYYNPKKMRVPLLDLRRPSDQLDFSGIDSLKYSDRYLLELPGMFHTSFTTDPMIIRRFPTTILGIDPEIGVRGYQVVCRYVLNFLNAFLKSENGGLKFLSSKPESTGIPEGVVRTRFVKGLEAPPTEPEFARIVAQEGLQRAIEIYNRLKKAEPQQEIIKESILNNLGYEYLANRQLAQALDIFKLNVEAHPKSGDAYDSLAEAYMVSGDKSLAIKFYKRSVELNPNNKNGIEMLKKLEGK